MRFGICLAAVLLAFWSSAWAGDSDLNPVEITILVYHEEGLSRQTLAVSENQAAMILRKAGIDTRWVDCSSELEGNHETCHQLDVPTQFVVRIVPQSSGPSDIVFGVAFLGEDGRGKYSDVFWDRCVEMQRDSGVNAATLLGTIAAHEIGHLILGSNAHSAIGIMSPHWQKRELRHAGMGSLLFTPDQSVHMKARIRSWQSRTDQIQLVSRSGRW